MRELLKSITKREWLRVCILALGVIVIMAIPYLYGYLTAPEGMVYTGLHHLAPGDTNVFLSMIEQTEQGNNVFLNLYTSEDQARIFVNPLWLSVGWLAKIFHMPGLLALHVARSLWIAAFVVIAYLLLSLFFFDIRRRWWSLIAILFTSGLGVFFNPFLFNVNNIYEHPTDIWVTESITFLTLYHSPHLVASLTLILLIFFFMFLAFRSDKLRYSFGAGISCLLMLWFHPFNGPTVYVVIATYLILLFLMKRKIIWSHVKHFAVLCVMPIPAVVYLLTISQTDWVIRNWSAQNILLSPSIWMYIIGYGLLLPCALAGVIISLKRVNERRIFLIAWLLSSGLLIYFPISFQRRMSEGLHIPIAILGFIGVYAFIQWLSTRYGKGNIRIYTVIMFFGLFLPLTNLQILGQDIYLYSSKKALPYYLAQQEVDAMRWLRDNSRIDQVTFSSYYIGNYIPAYSGRIVYIGHGPQTINLVEKMEITEWFWQEDANTAQKNRFLSDNGIDFVYFGQKEKELGSFNPATKSYLKEVFSNDEVIIYRVQ